jgi:hypothetical protein
MVGSTARSLALFGPGGPSPGRAVGGSAPLREVLVGAGVEVVSPPESVTSYLLAEDDLPPAL